MRAHNVNRIGRTAAILSAFFALLYSVFQLLTVFKVIPHPDELFWLFLPSLFLAPSFLISIISLHYSTGAGRKIFTAIAVAFAVIYSAFVVIVYFTQLAIVIPQIQAKAIDETHLLAFTDKSFMVAVDCMGYTFMNASTFAAAFAFRNEKSKWLYRSLLWNGLLTPVMVAAFFMLPFFYVGGLWIITFPTAMINAAKWFGKDAVRTGKKTIQQMPNLIIQKAVKHELQ